MKRYISLVEDVCLRQQPDSLSMLYVEKNSWQEIGINESAFEILKRIDGNHTFETLVEDMVILFNEKKDKVISIVSSFIQTLEQQNFIIFNDVSHHSPVIIKGNQIYFSPDFMILELTHNCPLKCKYCYANAGIGASMDISKLLPLIEELHGFGTNYFQLTGGEPFAYSYIEDVVNLLLEKKIKFSITTSGFYWNKRVQKIMDKLVGREVFIQVSLDGLSQTHNKIRGDTRAYDHAVRFLKESINRNIPTNVATCLVQQEIREIEELSYYLRDLGVNQHRLGMITDLGRAVENKVSSAITVKEFLNITANLKKKLDNDTFHIGLLEDFENLECRPNKSCGAGFKLYNLTPKLTLFPCTIFNINIGNLNTEKLEDVFIRNTRLFSNMSAPSDELCHSCELIDNCRDCLAEGFSNKNKVEKCHWYENTYKPIESKI